MALKRGSNVDYGKNEIQNARVQNLASAPSSPVEGQIYYDTTLHQFGYYNGTTWTYGTTPADASGSTKGIVQLTNDLGGTATAPTVVNLHLAGDTAVNHKLTSVTDPTVAQDAATKHYVDTTTLNGSLNWKASVRLASAANIPSLSGALTVDGIGTVVGDRILVLNQTTQSQNGIYVVASGAWSRSTDANSVALLTQAVVMVESGGATNGWTSWFCETIRSDTLGVSDVLWNQMPIALGLGPSYSAYAMPASTTLAQLATGNPTASSVSFNSQRAANVLDPSLPQDAATKNYVDNKVNGLSWKNPVVVATATALPAYTQSGAGATGTLTANVSAALTVDGYALQLNERILVKDGAAGKDNGIYQMTQLGDGSHPYILTRDSDATTVAQLQDATVMVERGTANADTVWNLSNVPGFTVDTTALIWVQIQSGTAIVGDGTYTTRSTNQLTIILSTDEAAASVANGAVAATAVGVSRIVKFVFKGDSSTNPFTLTHNLNTRQVQVVGQVDNSGAPGAPIELDWAPSSVNAITITFPSVPTTGTPYYVSVTG